MITYARSRTHVLSARLFPFRHSQASRPALPFAAGLAPAPARLAPNRCGGIQNGRRASGLERSREVAEWREHGRAWTVSRRGAPWQRARTHSESDVSVPKASREKTSEPGRKKRSSRLAACGLFHRRPRVADASLQASTGVHVRTLIYLSPSPSSSRSPPASIAPVRCQSYSSAPSPVPVPRPASVAPLRPPKRRLPVFSHRLRVPAGRARESG